MTDSSSEGDLESQEWEWLSRRLVETLHAESLSRFGGTPGMRDEGLLESALARPQNLARYEEPSTFQLASAYCEGIVNNHPFADGNKRAGLLAARAFLFKDGLPAGAGGGGDGRRGPSSGGRRSRTRGFHRVD